MDDPQPDAVPTRARWTRRQVVIRGAAAAMAGVVGAAAADTGAGAAAKGKGKRIGPVSQVPVGESAAFTDPTTQTPPS